MEKFGGNVFFKLKIADKEEVKCQIESVQVCSSFSGPLYLNE